MDTIESIDPETIMLFTDGSCHNKNSGGDGKGGWAWVGMYQGFYTEKSGYLPQATNNTAELTAIREALKAIRDRNHPTLVITDSKYALNALTVWPDLWRRQNWKNSVGDDVANILLIQEVLSVMETFDSVRVAWTRGHGKGDHPYHKFNNRADELATQARKAGRNKLTK